VADVTLSVLSVAYPFATVSPDSVGGAEQILSTLDRALVSAGHRSVVIACEDSRTAGTLIAMPRANGKISEASQAEMWTRYRRAIADTLACRPLDLVHLHGVDYHHYLPSPGTPVLVTIHLPADWYPPETLSSGRADTWLHGVSPALGAAARDRSNLLAPIENGVPVHALSARHAKRRFALILGRICAEKGVHLAIDAAKRADIPLLIAGDVFPYEAHLNYFASEILPRLDGHRRFIGPVGFGRKRRLLTAARCLLVPSVVPETSSLVAREALACGTPVIGFPHGALLDVIEDGRTGYLVRNVEGMAEAIDTCAGLHPSSCREVARVRFSEERMIAEYFAVYERIAARQGALAS
jgi:glycosyltransferase involved in cell wall biosynthesis